MNGSDPQTVLMRHPYLFTRYHLLNRVASTTARSTYAATEVLSHHERHHSRLDPIAERATAELVAGALVGRAGTIPGQHLPRFPPEQPHGTVLAAAIG